MGIRASPVSPPAKTAESYLVRLDELISAQEDLVTRHTARSRELRMSARETLAGGVASAWQDAVPCAIWIERGSGQRVWDVDGFSYVDLHGGFGACIAGHCHPLLVEAMEHRLRKGIHFGQPTEDLIPVSRLLSERFGLPLWRFSNSGSESTLDAVHLVRAVTGRKKIIKVEGAFHGHHDSVQVSTYGSDQTDIGPPDRPLSVPFGPAYPRETVNLTLVVPFGDLDAVERLLVEHPGDIAGMIVEPIMMNIGMILPPDNYHRDLKELLHAHGALLVFDEVKTGLAVAPGGATELLGVTPDIVCLAKALGGGVPCAAIGGTAKVMSFIADNTYAQMGTFNGNPLAMVAARTVLAEILTPAAYHHIETLRTAIADGITELMHRHGIPGYVVSAGAKGSIIFTERLRDYRDFLAYPDQWGHAHSLYQLNHGVFLPPWGKTEQFTLSVQHTLEDALLFVSNFDAFCQTVNVAGRGPDASLG